VQRSSRTAQVRAGRVPSLIRLLRAPHAGA
jgi:hypothetical protein